MMSSLGETAYKIKQGHSLLWEFIREVYRGKGIAPTLMNLQIRQEVELKGIVLDVGGKQ